MEDDMGIGRRKGMWIYDTEDKDTERHRDDSAGEGVATGLAAGVQEQAAIRSPSPHGTVCAVCNAGQ